jgi:hypothetical protein
VQELVEILVHVGDVRLRGGDDEMMRALEDAAEGEDEAEAADAQQALDNAHLLHHILHQADALEPASTEALDQLGVVPDSPLVAADLVQTPGQAQQQDPLHQQAQAAQSPQAGQALQPLRPAAGTAAWYVMRRDEPVAPGSSITVLQAAYTFLIIKREGKMTDASFKTLLHVVQNGFMPWGHSFPRYGSAAIKSFIRLQVCRRYGHESAMPQTCTVFVMWVKFTHRQVSQS